MSEKKINDIEIVLFELSDEAFTELEEFMQKNFNYEELAYISTFIIASTFSHVTEENWGLDTVNKIFNSYSTVHLNHRIEDAQSRNMAPTNFNEENLSNLQVKQIERIRFYDANRSQNDDPDEHFYNLSKVSERF